MSESKQIKYIFGKTYQIKLDDLLPNPAQPRKYFDETEIASLAKDIKNNGLIQDISFTQIEGQLYIVAGERRCRAYKQIGRPTIQGKYIEGDLSVLALVENVLRANLTTIEFSEAVFAIKEKSKLTPKQISGLLGKEKNTISEILKIASLPESIRNDARSKPEMTRKELLKIARQKDITLQGAMYKKLCDRLNPKDKIKKGNAKIDKNPTERRAVKAECKRIEHIATTLPTQYQKLLEKNKNDFNDSEKKKLQQAYELLKISAEEMLTK